MVINRAKFGVCAFSDFREVETYKGMVALIGGVFKNKYCFWEGKECSEI